MKQHSEGSILYFLNKLQLVRLLAWSMAQIAFFCIGNSLLNVQIIKPYVALVWKSKWYEIK